MSVLKENSQSALSSTPSSSNVTLNESIIAKRKEKPMPVNIKSIRQRHAQMIARVAEENEKTRNEENERQLLANLRFRTKNIDSKDAESELDKCITQEDFLRMKVLGQFNKGFVIAQLDQDLFIIDQHAADEIYNFETLQRGGKIDKQMLLQPRYLELPASAEAILIDNIALVEKSGYDMQVTFFS